MGVKIREKELKGGKKSLYLDIHHKGERKYEFLELYLTGDKEKDQRAYREASKRKEEVEDLLSQGNFGDKSHEEDPNNNEMELKEVDFSYVVDLYISESRRKEIIIVARGITKAIDIAVKTHAHKDYGELAIMSIKTIEGGVIDIKSPNVFYVNEWNK